VSYYSALDLVPAALVLVLLGAAPPPAAQRLKQLEKAPLIDESLNSPRYT
jgi:hypothetical protein